MVLMAPVMAVMMMLDQIRGNPMNHKITDGEDETFDEIEADGLLRDGAREKLEFYRYFTYHFDGREDLKDDESMIETQKPMWDHFVATPKKKGSSNNRFKESLLVDVNGSGDDKLWWYGKKAPSEYK
jgi:hypothetical protein